MKGSLGELGIDNFYISKIYEDGIDEDIKKTKGIYYTPKIIVDYIMEKTLKKHNIVENPYPKIIDISCGCGNFLLEAYDILYNLLEENIYELKEKYKDDYWSIDNIHRHIVENCIYGLDTDNNAIDILKTSFNNKDINFNIVNTCNLNIYCEDGLKKEWDFKFDYIVGNPPYVGHKLLDKEYKKYLLEKYSQVYSNKSDLYFCFYKKAIDLIKEDGIISIITPRYFLESISGKGLRKYINKNTYIIEIVDFLGTNVFKKVGISSCILTLKSKSSEVNIIDNYINIYKMNDESIKIDDIEILNDFHMNNLFENFIINQNSFNENWILTNEEDNNFYNKIESRCNYYLGDIVTSFQGIITGCDKAFILEKESDNINCVPKIILKSWVKNKNIRKYIIEDTKYILIYSNDINDEIIYKDLIKTYIEPYRHKLENRRECKKNIRKWYELQWGREKNLFERKKIMYPYKSKNNRFAIDNNNLYCSADVYSFFIKDNYKNDFSYEYLVGVLNSSVYNKYFKVTAKNMGKNIYDYYPNKVMKIKIFKDNNYEEIESLSKEIIKILQKENSLQKESLYKEQIYILETRINNLIKESLSL